MQRPNPITLGQLLGTLVRRCSCPVRIDDNPRLDLWIQFFHARQATFNKIDGRKLTVANEFGGRLQGVGEVSHGIVVVRGANQRY